MLLRSRIPFSCSCSCSTGRLPDPRIQSSDCDVLRLIEKPSDHAETIFDRQRISELRRVPDYSLDLLAYDHEFTPHRGFGPAKTLSLGAVTLGDQALNLHGIRQRRRR